MGTATGGMVTAGTLSVEAAAGISAATGAVAAGAATNATVSVVNNRGNLGAVLKDVTSSDAMKGYVIAGATAGLTSAYFGDWTGTQTNTLTGKVTTPGLLNTWSGVGKFAANQTLQSGTSMLLSKALGQGGSASDALKSALFNTLAAASFNWVGNFTEGVIADGSAPKIAVHAMVGGLLSEATGGDFKTGALAAGANEALVTHLDALVKGNEELLTMSSQIVGVMAAAGQKDADAAALEKGSWVAKNATQYNYLGEHQKSQRAKELAESEGALDRLRINTKWELIDAGQDAGFAGGAVVGVPEGLIDTVKGILEAAGSPRQTFRALKSVLESDDVLGHVSDTMKQSYIERIDNLQSEYERAGASGSFNAGREAGKLISDVVALGTGVGGALKSGALLVEKVTAKVVKAELTVAKGTGAVVDDTIKALPAPRQIDASWSASTYNKGGLMTGIEHVFYRHGPDSGFANVSKFSQGTSVKDVSSYVDNALRYGKVTPNGPGGHVIEYNAGKVIGTNVSGAPTSTIKINVRDGVIQTAFPY